jgi:hypothetical protein
VFEFGAAFRELLTTCLKNGMVCYNLALTFSISGCG